MKRIIALSLLIMLASVAAFSDIARPDKTPKVKPTPKFRMTNTTMTMEIRTQGNLAQTTLRIPKSQLKYLAELEQNNDEDSDNTAAVTGGYSRTQTMVSGAFLTLALVFGGIWFVRSGKSATSTGRSLVILAVLTAAGSAATLVFANVAPPQRRPAITSKLFDKKVLPYGSYATGNVRVETSPDDVLELIVLDVPSDKANAEE